MALPGPALTCRAGSCRGPSWNGWQGLDVIRAAREAIGVALDSAIHSRYFGTGSVGPEDIARNYVWLHQQPRSSWTHELDLRPWQETF